MLSSIVNSTLLTCAIAVHMFTSFVLKPFGKFRLLSQWSMIAIMLVLGGMFITPIILVSLYTPTLNNNLCIAIAYPASLPFSITYVCVTCIYIAIFMIPTAITITKGLRKSHNSKVMNKKKMLIVRLVVQTGSQMLLAFVIAAVLIMEGFDIHKEIYVFFITFPLNACLNPLMYTLTWKKLRHFPLIIFLKLFKFAMKHTKALYDRYTSPY